jgi:hypothetical protein
MPISLIRADIQASFFGRLSLKVRRLSGLALHKSADAANAWPDRPPSIRQFGFTIAQSIFRLLI